MSSVGLARVISTTRSPSMKPPAIMMRFPCISISCPTLQSDEDKKSHKLILKLYFGEKSKVFQFPLHEIQWIVTKLGCWVIHK